MTIYQEEMQRRAFRYGCTIAHDETTDLMAIIHHGQQIAEISVKGFMYYDTTKISDEESRGCIRSQAQHRQANRRV